MNLITINKAVMQGRLVISPSWISNGRWVVRRVAVKNESQCANKEVARAVFDITDNSVMEYETDDMFTKLIESAITKTNDADIEHYERTSILKNGKFRVFVSSLSYLILDENYVQLFGGIAEGLYGHANSDVYVNSMDNIIFLVAKVKLIDTKEFKDDIKKIYSVIKSQSGKKGV